MQEKEPETDARHVCKQSTGAESPTESVGCCPRCRCPGPRQPPFSRPFSSAGPRGEANTASGSARRSCLHTQLLAAVSDTPLNHATRRRLLPGKRAGSVGSPSVIASGRIMAQARLLYHRIRTPLQTPRRASREERSKRNAPVCLAERARDGLSPGTTPRARWLLGAPRFPLRGRRLGRGKGVEGPFPWKSRLFSMPPLEARLRARMPTGSPHLVPPFD